MAWHVAVVGTGNWSQVHLETLAASEHVSQITLAGRNATALADLAARFSKVTTTSTDLFATLTSPSVDVVDIVLPHHLHATTAIAAMSAGKHVICEKPAGMDVEQFDRIVAKARSTDRRFLVIMNQLYNPVTQRVRELVDSGALGRTFLVAETAFSRHDRHYRDPNTWRTRWSTAGGGVLIDGGYHMVYKHLHWLGGIGHPRWVVADAAQLAVSKGGETEPSQGEDFVSYTVGFDDSLRIVSSHAWTLAAGPSHPHQAFIAGTEGTLEITGDPQAPLRLRTASQSEVIDVAEGPTTNTSTLDACLRDCLTSLASGDAPRFATLSAARRTLALIGAVYESARSGRRVDLP